MATVLTKEQIVSIFLFLALGVLLFLLLDLLAPYAVPVGWAIILAVVFFPLHHTIERVLCKRPSLAAGTSTFLVFAVVVVPTLLLSGVIAREAVDGYQKIASYLRQTGYAEILNRIGSIWPIEPVWHWAKDRMAAADSDPTSFLLSGLRWLSEMAATHATQIARNVVGFFIATGIFVFTLFFAFRDGTDYLDRFITAIPMAESDRDKLFNSLRITIRAVVQGLTVTAAIQSVLVGLALWLLAVPFSLLLATATFLLAFLPVGGAALVWLPCAVGLILTGHITKGLILLGWGATVVSLIDNFVRPLLIGSQARISTPVLFFGIIGGLQAYGLIGLFVGPSLLAAFACLLAIYRERYLETSRATAPPPSLED